jgi:Fe-S-cluster containining protein
MRAGFSVGWWFWKNCSDPMIMTTEEGEPEGRSVRTQSQAGPLRAELPALYLELAQEIAAAAPVCEVSGRCCRFRDYGHTLFLSRPEAELLLQKPFPPDAVIDAGSCPYQVGTLCTARENRPLGCRVYYCDPQYAGVGEELSERYIKRLKDLHDSSGAVWEYRPLVAFLPEATKP